MPLAEAKVVVRNLFDSHAEGGMVGPDTYHIVISTMRTNVHYLSTIIILLRWWC